MCTTAPKCNITSEFQQNTTVTAPHFKPHYSHSATFHTTLLSQRHISHNTTVTAPHFTQHYCHSTTFHTTLLPQRHISHNTTVTAPHFTQHYCHSTTFHTTLLSQRHISHNSPSHHQYCSEFHENATRSFVFAITSQLAMQYQLRPNQNGGMLLKESTNIVCFWHI